MDAAVNPSCQEQRENIPAESVSHLHVSTFQYYIHDTQAAEDTVFGPKPAYPLSIHTTSKLQTPISHTASCSLSRLLSADERDDPAQLCTLRRMLLDQSIRDSIGLRQLGRRLQHAILKLQHLLKRVVQKWSGERNGIRRRLIQTHLQLPRSLLLLRHSRFCWLLRLRLRPWQLSA